MLRRVTWPSQIQALDEQILHSVHGSPPWLVPLFVIVTVIGGGWGLIVLVLFAASRATRTATLWLLAAIVAQSAVVAGIKLLVRRVRPCDALGWCAPVNIGSPGGFSFPSGHSAGSFAFAAFIAVRAPRYAPLAIVWAVLVGWSRCVLGVHYPSDVLTGAVVGSVVGVVFARLSLRSKAAPARPEAS